MRVASLKSLIFLWMISALTFACQRGSNSTGSDSGIQAAQSSGTDAIPSWQSLPSNASDRARVYQQIVQKIMQSSTEPMTAAGSCEAFTQSWLKILNVKHGYKLFYAQTSGNSQVKKVDGTTFTMDKIHVYVVDRELCSGQGECENEIIIDPTFVQFMEPGECLYGETGEFCKDADALRSLPKVLVGTPSTVRSFYKNHQQKVRLYSSSGQDPNAGKYKGDSAADLFYSLSHNSKNRLLIPLFQNE